MTTEGGLDVVGQEARLNEMAARLRDAGIRVSLFVEADEAQLDASSRVGADIVELHTGRYCHETGAGRDAELARIKSASQYAASLGLECHAGHGLGFETVGDIAALPELVELNIGHFLIGASVFSGLSEAIKTMRQIMDDARGNSA